MSLQAAEKERPLDKVTKGIFIHNKIQNVFDA